MNKKLCFSILLLFTLLFTAIPGSLKAQTTLGLGEIAFTGYQSDNPDKFSFMLLNPIVAGTTIYFTDNGWFAAGGFNETEGILSWTADVDYPASTQILILPATSQGLDINGLAAGTVLNPDGSTNALSLSPSGDQIFAFQGALPTATDLSGFLAAIQMNGGWDSNAGSSTISAQPSVFEDGVNSISFSPEMDNTVYNCADQFAPIGTSPAEIAAEINNFQGWTTSNSTGLEIPKACSFAACCSSIDVIKNDGPSCPGGTDGILTIIATVCSQQGIYTINGPISGTNTTGIFTDVPEGNYTIMVEDASFGAGECIADSTYKIEVFDTEPPVLTPAANVTGLVCGGPLPTAATTALEYIEQGGSIIDNCSPLADMTIFHQVETTGDFCNNGNPYTITRKYYITDGFANMSMSEHSLSFIENIEVPVITNILPACYKTCGEMANPSVDDVEYVTSCNAGATVNIDGPVLIGSPNCQDAIYRYSYSVTDACGLTSESVERDFIVSNSGPSIVGPSYNLILNCGNSNNQSYIDAHLASVTANTSCGLGATIEYTPSTFDLQSCGSSTVVTFVVSDDCGRTAVTSTVIAIEDNTAPVFTVVPPSTCDEIECGGDSDYWFNHWIDYMLDGLIAEDGCNDNVSITAVNPQLNTTCNGNGQAISVVTFQATDDCNNEATMTGTFTIQNSSPAFFSNVPVDTIIDCGTNVVFETVVVNQQCQTTVTSIDDVDFSDVCAIKHIRTWTATDACGNTSTSVSQTITVVDTEAPEFTFVPANAMSVCGIAVVFGDPVTIDNCSNPVTLDFVDTETGIDCSKVFTRTWTATDDCGNESVASQTITLFDATPPGGLTGMIYTEDGQAVENVSLSLDGNNGNTLTSVSQGDGTYGYDGLELGQNYMLEPYLNTDPLNGVSTFDMVIISQHILETMPLDSPYKMIAADVNNSGSITTVDLVELRKLILLVDETFSNNTSWRFIEADYVFPSATNPFANLFPEVTNINGLTVGEEHNYMGVKIGDVNTSVVSNSMAPAESREIKGELTFVVKDAMIHAEEEYELVVKASDFNRVSGYQFTLSFDFAKMDFVRMTPGSIPGLTEGNFGLTKEKDGFITSSWNSNVGETIAPDAELFRLVFKAKTEVILSEAISIGSRYTRAEAYNNALELLDVNLHFDGAITERKPGYVLYQNQPNPFYKTTVVGFELPKAASATLSIYDVSGHLLTEIKGEYRRGYNEVILDKRDFSSAGVLYYKLKTAGFEATKKMVIVD